MLALAGIVPLVLPVNRQGDEYNPPGPVLAGEKTVRDIPVRYGVKMGQQCLLSAFTASGLAKSTLCSPAGEA